MKLNDRIIITNLFETYGSLLTDKQVQIFEMYYEDDYSINEICDILAITKNGVYNSLKQTEAKLASYEAKLKIVANKNANIELLKTHGVEQTVIDQLL